MVMFENLQSVFEHPQHFLVFEGRMPGSLQLSDPFPLRIYDSVPFGYVPGGHCQFGFGFIKHLADYNAVFASLRANCKENAGSASGLPGIARKEPRPVSIRPPEPASSKQCHVLFRARSRQSTHERAITIVPKRCWQATSANAA